MVRKIVTTAAASLAFAGIAGAVEGIQITPNGGTPSVIGAAHQFSGHAVVGPVYPATDVTRATTGLVTFAPGARTAWHTHPVVDWLELVTDRQYLEN